MPSKKLFGKGFRALKLRSSGRGTKTVKSLTFEEIDNAIHQGCLRADNREFTIILLGKSSEGSKITGID